MLVAALFTSPLPLFLTAGALSIIVTLWGVRVPLLAVLFLFGSLLVGQTIRVPLWGQSGGLLISDIAVAMVLAVALLRYRRDVLDRAWARRLTLVTIPFVVWSLWGLFMNSTIVAGTELLIGVAYWLRLSCYLFLLPALIEIFRSRVRTGVLGVFSLVTAVALIGMLQLWFVPDLSVVPGGWDPHQGRLVATWLDPNLVGGLFAITIPWCIATAAYLGWFRQRPLLMSLWVALQVLALIATQSRSSIAALMLSLVALSPLFIAWLGQPHATQQKLRLLGGVGILALALLGSFIVLGERAWGVLLIDPTVAMRLTALREIAYFAADHPVMGVGYNLYQFAALRAGLITDVSLHSRAGADNSLLTLWVTTGIVGVILFLLPYVTVGHYMLRAPRATRTVAAGTLCALLVWLFHSQFVNSLLYAHLLAAVASMIALSCAMVADSKQL